MRMETARGESATYAASIRALFIVNPAAGGGRALRALPRIRATLAELGAHAEIAVASGPGHLEALACRAALERRAPVIAVGGDGTLQAVVNGVIRGGGAPVALVAAGRGNDLARTLRLPRGVGDATRLALTGETRRIDLGRCGERCFASAAGVGLDARVAAAVRATGGGVGAYAYHALRELWRAAPVELTLRLDGETVHRSATLVAVANGRYFGGGMLVAPDADPRDGLLDVVVADAMPRGELLRLLPRLYYGRHVGHPAISFHRARSVRIDGPAGTPTHLDGEPGPPLPREIEVAPGGLELVLPGPSAAHAPAHDPKARLSRSSRG